MVLLDVTPLSLGIETFGGLMNVIIPRNSTIPIKAGEMFTNAMAGQESMLIKVLQGERELAKDNWKLGWMTGLAARFATAGAAQTLWAGFAQAVAGGRLATVGTVAGHLGFQLPHPLFQLRQTILQFQETSTSTSGWPGPAIRVPRG